MRVITDETIQETTTEEPTNSDHAPTTQESPATELTREEALRDLARRADGGNAQALSNLRELLDRDPEIWRHVGDLASLAERSWLDAIAAGDMLAYECIRRKFDEIKAEITGDDAPPLEQLMCRQVAITWLAAQFGEIQAAGDDGGNSSVIQSRLRRAESGQRRLMTSIKTLALLRSSLARGLRPLSVFDPTRRKMA